MAQMKDVAKRANVGIGTVSRVINNTGYVSEESRSKVELAIKELNYIPNQFGRNLKKQESKLVALFIPTISHQFFAKLAYYIEDELFKNGYGLIVSCSQGNKEKELNLLKLLKTNQVDGIILVTTHKYINNEFNNLNIVTFDRHIDGVPCITSDNYDSTYRALKELVKQGCKKIGYIGGKSTVDSETAQRFNAYNDIIKEYALESYVAYEAILHGGEFELANKFLSNNELDAIFAQSDVLANMCYQIACSKNLQVPHKLKIVGYDGAFEENYNNVKITTIQQDLRKISSELVKKLITKNKDNDKVFVKTNYIIGETT